jgi:hypothetical protein
MAAQRLVEPAVDLREVVALQAQDVGAAEIAARNRGLELDGVRTWAMRGTLHLLHPEDVGWIVALLGPVFIATGKRRRDQLGLDDELCARALDALREVLTTPMDRAPLVSALAEVGIVLDPKSQAPAHLLAFAAYSGVIWRGLDDTYRLATWTGTPEHGVAELFRRYLNAYEPATLHDFVAWSGLPVRRVKAEVELEGLVDTGFGWVSAGTRPVEPSRTIRLLGHFDTYLLGYRDRSLALPAEFAPKIQTGGGFLTPHVVLDGRVVGTWRNVRGEVLVAPFVEEEGAELRRLACEDTR